MQPELAEHRGGADGHVLAGTREAQNLGVDPPRRRQKFIGGKNAIAQIGFGDRAKAYDAARSGYRGQFRRIGMGRVHEAPARVDRHMIEQPGDRSLSRPGETGFNLACLFGDVDMDRP